MLNINLKKVDDDDDIEMHCASKKERNLYVYL